MRVLIAIDEMTLYHPMFLFNLIKKLKKKNYKIEVALVTKIFKKSNLEKYLFSNLYKLTLYEILLLSLKRIMLPLVGFITRYFDIYYSVESVLKVSKIKFFKVKLDINKEKYINKIIDYEPDLIISSCSTIFKKRLLSIPKYGCMNRHSSLLPSYGGLCPIFHSISQGQKTLGVTIHKMESKIDTGQILAQRIVENKDNNLSEIYKNCFEVSSDLVIEAIDNLINKKFIKNSYPESYFSFPNEKQWEMFRKNNGKFI